MKPRARAQLVRVLRRFARVLVACFALVGVLGMAVVPAAVSLARALRAPSCHCPHGDDAEGIAEKKACPCCHAHEGDGGCLPASGTGGPGQLALAPPAHGELVPMPILVGEVGSLEVAPLRGRIPPLQLDRPPRA